MKTALFLLLIAISSHATPVLSNSLSLSPAQDNTLIDDPSGAISNGSGPVFHAGNNGASNTRRAVIAFNIAASIPQGAMIDSVTLTLYVSSAPNETVRQFTLHRILSAWGEGQSSASGGSGAPSTPGDATWIHTFYPDSSWTTPGGDFDAAASAMLNIGGLGHYRFSGEALTADVQQWLDEPANDHGWLLRGEENEASTVRRFDSRENAVVANRPVLRVWYTAPSTPVTPATWGRTKQLFQNDTQKGADE